jgi:DNA-directed RNA polymerase subunit L
MEVKENVRKFLESKEDEIIKLWKSIYEGFEKEGEEGGDGIKKVLERKAKSIQDDFESIKKDIEKQMGGEA